MESVVKIEKLIKELRELDSGASEGMFSDYSSSDLERAAEWCEKNDSNLLVPIDDELKLRADGEHDAYMFEGEVR